MAGFYDYLRMGMGWHSSTVASPVEPAPPAGDAGGRYFAPLPERMPKKRKRKKYIDGAAAVAFSADTQGYGRVSLGAAWQERDELAVVAMMFQN